jgi:hypothetical protein
MLYPLYVVRITSWYIHLYASTTVGCPRFKRLTTCLIKSLIKYQVIVMHRRMIQRRGDLEGARPALEKVCCPVDMNGLAHILFSRRHL